MSKNNNKKDNFKQLQKEWYAKLKKSGFKDIEKTEYVFVNHLHRVPKPMKEKAYLGEQPRWKIQEEYYTNARHFATNYEFPSELDAAIWTYHSEGLGCRAIAKILNDANIKIQKTKINDLIRKYAITMRKNLWLEGLEMETEQ